MVREMMTDTRWVNGWVEQRKRQLIRELVRQGHIPCSLVREVKSPHTGNMWTVMLTIPSVENPRTVQLQFTTLQDVDGVYVYHTVECKDAVLVVILNPHVFRRYRERMALGDKLTTMQLIRRFMKMNRRGSVQLEGKYDGKQSWALYTDEGMVLGHYVSDLVYWGKTFITHDMVHDGKQRRVAQRGAKDFRKQRGSSRKTLAESAQLTRQTESITNQCEQEFREQTGERRNRTSRM